jgi:hypothetical protein
MKIMMEESILKAEKKNDDKYCRQWTKDLTPTWQYFSSTWSATSRRECAICLQDNCMCSLTICVVESVIFNCNRRRSIRVWQSLTTSGRFELELCTICDDDNERLQSVWVTVAVVFVVFVIVVCRRQCRRRGVDVRLTVEYGNRVVCAISRLAASHV